MTEGKLGYNNRSGIAWALGALAQGQAARKKYTYTHRPLLAARSRPYTHTHVPALSSVTVALRKRTGWAFCQHIGRVASLGLAGRLWVRDMCAHAVRGESDGRKGLH